MNKLKTRLTTALVDFGSWLLEQYRRPIILFCWLFGHDHWLSVDYQILGECSLFQCRRCRHSYVMKVVKYDVPETLQILNIMELRNDPQTDFHTAEKGD